MTDDTVYRQAAIDALNLADDKGEIVSLLDVLQIINALPSAQPMCEEVSPEEVLDAITINPASLWHARKLFTFLQKEGYVICKKT